MISQKLQDAINAQVTAENYSSNLYLSMASYAESNGYKGFSKWLRVQANEERTHGMKLFDYVLARGGKAVIGAVAAPPPEFGTMLELFEGVQKHEHHVTELIGKLYTAAVAENDVAAQIFLQWFVTEQVEEEASAAEVTDKIRMVGDRPGTLLYLDKEFGKRGQ